MRKEQPPAKEQQEKDRQQAIEDLKSRYFGLAMTDGEIEIRSIDSVDDYYEIGDAAVFVAGLPNIFSKKIR